jgi:hypothetical protein
VILHVSPEQFEEERGTGIQPWSLKYPQNIFFSFLKEEEEEKDEAWPQNHKYIPSFL